MLQSPNLKFNLILQNQSQKEVTANEALIKIDALINNCVIEIWSNTFSSQPTSGDMYIIGQNPSIQEWSNKQNYIAYYYVNKWYFIQPKTGVTLWVKNMKKLYTYHETQWIPSL